MRVRLFREELAQRAVGAAERAVAAAETEVENRRKELARYRVWRREEENRRYAAILNQLLGAAELDRFKAGLVALAAAEQQREQEVMQAEETCNQCRTRLESCRHQLVLARKDTARLQTHRDIWNDAQRLENTRQEDRELEEFRPVPSMEADA